jgi:endonuclease/exonuclease/phosphatase family metal-dependent hydrolase
MRHAVVAVAVLVGCNDTTHVYPPWSGPKADDQLRVMTYNVNFGLPGDVSSMDAVDKANADIVFLQETNREWQRALVARFGAEYPHQRFTPPERWLAGGMGLLSQYPVVSLQHLDSHGGMFFAWRVVLDTKLGRIQVLNVHLRPPVTDGGSYAVGYFTTSGNRLEEIENHYAALDPKLPTIVVGDFNEEGDGRALQFLVDHGFADAVAEFNGTKPTWSWPVGGMTLRFQRDHMMHDATLIPTRAVIVEAGRSDHKPVWADFTRMQP